MTDKNRLEWVTPELIEYGDVSRLTEIEYKTHGTGDALAESQLSVWLSGNINS